MEKHWRKKKHHKTQRGFALSLYFYLHRTITPYEVTKRKLCFTFIIFSNSDTHHLLLHAIEYIQIICDVNVFSYAIESSPKYHSPLWVYNYIPNSYLCLSAINRHDMEIARPTFCVLTTQRDDSETS